MSAMGTPAPANSAPAPAATTTSAPAESAQPAAPALPIAASKEQRLQQLLSQYKADQITPQQYHEQRAAILAEP
jgi:hypothetical protein